MSSFFFVVVGFEKWNSPKTGCNPIGKGTDHGPLSALSRNEFLHPPPAFLRGWSGKARKEEVVPDYAVEGALFVSPLGGNRHKPECGDLLAEPGILVAVEEGASEGGNWVDLAELSIEESAPPVFASCGNDGSDSVELPCPRIGSGAGFGYKGSRGGKEILLYEAQDVCAAEKQPDGSQILGQKVTRDEKAIDGAKTAGAGTSLKTCERPHLLLLTSREYWRRLVY